MEKMVYFKDITSGQQLDDVDISVHCDVKIFEWLMSWTKHQDIEVKNVLTKERLNTFS